MPDYILEPLDTDSEDIYQDAVEYIQATYPNWVPSEGQLDVLILRFVSLKMAVIADMASRVQRSIFRYFGDTVVKISPLPAANAVTSIQFNAVDTLGHTIPAGTLIALTDANGDLHLFSTTTNADILVGTTSIVTTAEAVDEGVSSNDLSGNVQLVEQIDWLANATTSVASAGGADAETDEDFLNRLAANFSLMAPRPVLAADFALISRNVPGVYRTTAIDNFLAGTNEQQTISHNYTGNGATGGTISFGGVTSGALAWNSTAAQIQTALEAMSNFEVGDIAVTGGPWPAAVTLTFKGRYEYTNVAQVTASAGTWTGGTTITITTTVGGVAANVVAENAVAVAAVDISGNALSATLKTTLDLYLQSLRQQNFIVTVLDPAYTAIDVTWAAIKQIGADSADIQTRGNAAIASWLSSANWGTPDWPIDVRAWTRKNVVRVQELYTILNNIQGLDYVTTLNFSNGAGATQDGTDKTLLGTFPLTKPGTIIGSVT